jgi:glycosyltransferase involved in cell wall biosynthesis
MELRAAGIPLLELPVRSLTNRTTLEGIRVLRGYLKAHRIQIVHTFDAPLNIFAAPLARFFGTPLVLTSQRSHRELIHPKYHPLLCFSHRVAHGVVTNCEAVRAHLQSDYGVPENKIRVLYNALNTSVFHAGGRKRVPLLQEASLVIGSVGLMRPEKCFSLLLDAFASILALHPGLKLLLVGGGPERARLERQAAGLGIRDACVFEPACADVACWLSSIDIFVLPSRTEALSNSLLEAMACGCCPVASQVGGNPELVVDGETGLLFESGDAPGLARRLETLIANCDLRHRLAENAAISAARFCSVASVRRTEELYLELLTRFRR